MSRGFKDLADTLAELEDIPSRIAGEVALGITEELRLQFDQGVDPYGKPWAPLLPQTVRRKGGDRRILRRSDTMSSETVARATSGAGIEISSVEYGQYHQTSRKILPDEGELPETWQDLIGSAADKAFSKVMK